MIKLKTGEHEFSIELGIYFIKISIILRKVGWITYMVIRGGVSNKPFFLHPLLSNLVNQTVVKWNTGWINERKKNSFIFFPFFFYSFVSVYVYKGDGHLRLCWDSDFEIRSLTSIFFRKMSVILANYQFLVIFL